MQSMCYLGLQTDLQRRETLRMPLRKLPRYILVFSHKSGSAEYAPHSQDFRRCHALIQQIGTAQDHAFPPSQTRHQTLAAKNVQRGLAAKVQELSATFRKKQRVYMESKYAWCGLFMPWPVIDTDDAADA
jgi:hypothetical protein